MTFREKLIETMRGDGVSFVNFYFPTVAAGEAAREAVESAKTIMDEYWKSHARPHIISTPPGPMHNLYRREYRSSFGPATEEPSIQIRWTSRDSGAADDMRWARESILGRRGIGMFRASPPPRVVSGTIQEYCDGRLHVDDAEAAWVRAEALLRDNLTLEQRRRLDTHKEFFVQSELGRLYRIRMGDVGNVDLMYDGTVMQRYCIHPKGVPVYDTMLAQKLMLEACEDEFLRVANKY